MAYFLPPLACLCAVVCHRHNNILGASLKPARPTALPTTFPSSPALPDARGGAMHLFFRIRQFRDRYGQAWWL